MAVQGRRQLYLSNFGSRRSRMPSNGLPLYAGCKSKENTARPFASALASIQPHCAAIPFVIALLHANRINEELTICGSSESYIRGTAAKCVWVVQATEMKSSCNVEHE